MTKVEYQLIAEAFRALCWHNRHSVLAGLMAELARRNPRFSLEKFAKESQFHGRFVESPWTPSSKVRK